MMSIYVIQYQLLLSIKTQLGLMTILEFSYLVVGHKGRKQNQIHSYQIQVIWEVYYKKKFVVQQLAFCSIILK